MAELTIDIRRGYQGTQHDFHLQPQWVEGGDESLVLTAKGKFTSTGLVGIYRISSFLGVMPGDIVEMAVDVIDADTQYVLYTRSIHKETLGIYDAWDHTFGCGQTKNLDITITCRVNDKNREGQLRAFFEGLVRIEVG